MIEAAVTPLHVGSSRYSQSGPSKVSPSLASEIKIPNASSWEIGKINCVNEIIDALDDEYTGFLGFDVTFLLAA
ncbi:MULTISPECIES: hypothetical protein [unclassified Rhizobium]|uniref:hypothetical protein n=1 Tax=unclassified Rhizobium TaxID=2613769 RepID=UPI00117AEB46|nr:MULTISPECIES: hypothetical protein [unclassified Rhizobium]ULJ82610.1 hypothetical protein MF410_32955 [Rhizobium sp. C104]